MKIVIIRNIVIFLQENACLDANIITVVKRKNIVILILDFVLLDVHHIVFAKMMNIVIIIYMNVSILAMIAKIRLVANILSI